MSLLEVEDLCYRVRTGSLFHKGSVDILRKITLSVESGETLGIIGESGSGKTTLARCIAGLISPDSGRIILNGDQVFSPTRHSTGVAGVIQLLFQNHSATLDPHIPVSASITEGIRGVSKGEVAVRARQLATSVALSEDVLSKYPHQLSGGQRQRVAIARAISVSPRLLILDEPTSALDALTGIQILGLLKAIQKAERTAIIYISHDLHTASLLCNRIAVMQNGSIIETGTTENILSRPGHEYTRLLTEAGSPPARSDAPPGT